MGGKALDLTGHKYNKLTVLHRQGHRHGKPAWFCECECGGTKIVTGADLRKGNTTSCGCRMKERAKTHGMTNTRLYGIWTGIKDRCYNSKNEHYNRYGERGIVMCDEWNNDFMNFYNWATANGYRNNLTIDRIDNDKGYEPFNCRWTTMQTQGTNKSNNVLIEINGEEKTISEWSRIAGIDPRTMGIRINRLGWTGEKLLKPARQKRDLNNLKI